jgi:NADH:ubiquinone oxidoreductase subunit 3 (subunit A)
MEPTIFDTNLVRFLILITCTGLLVGMFVALSKFLGPKRPNATKDLPFECGIQVKTDARSPYPVK